MLYILIIIIFFSLKMVLKRVLVVGLGVVGIVVVYSLFCCVDKFDVQVWEKVFVFGGVVIILEIKGGLVINDGKCIEMIDNILIQL